MNDKEFLIRVKADIKDAVTQLKQVSGEFKHTSQQATQSSKGLDSMGKSVTFLTQAFKAYISFRVVQDTIHRADAFNVLQQRIKTATAATGDYVEVSRQLYDISQRNGVELKNSVSLFQGLARIAPDLGATNDQMLTLTNLVQQLGTISGASKENLDAGLLQFSQGLASGIFRAEEFNSLLENVPEIAVRIAKGLNVSVGELRNMVINGKLASRDVFQSLVKQAGEINSEFVNMPLSVERATTKLETSFDRFLHQLDQATGFTDKLASGMSTIADRLDGRVTKGLRDELSFLQKQLDDLDKQASGESAQSRRNVLQLRIDRITEKINDSLIAQGGPVGIRLAIDKADKEISALAKRINDMINNHELGDAYNNLRHRLIELRKQREDLFKQLSDTELKITDAPAGKTGPTPAEQANAKKAQDLIAALKQQAETYGQTTEQIALYKLELLGATDAQKKAAKSWIQSIDAQKKAAELQQKANQIYADTRTEQEKLAAQLEEYDKLLEAGAIDWDTYSRAVFNAQEQFGEVAKAGDSAMEQLITATRGWGNEFTDTMVKMVQTGKLSFSDLADSIIADILRILVYQNITAPLFGSLGLPGFKAPTNHSGGMAGMGAHRVVNPMVFANAPRFHSGGVIPGLASNEVPTILTKGEEVLTQNDPRHINNLGKGTSSVKVEIIKNGSPVKVTDSAAQVDPRGMVVQVILDDYQTNGPISRRIGQGTTS